MSRVRPWLRALVLYIVLAFAMFGSAWSNPTYRSVGTAGDPELFMWMLTWVPYSITHALNPLFTDYLIYPHGANLMWTLIPIVPGLLLAPVTFSFGPVVAYNLAMTLAIAMSAWSSYVAINVLVDDRVGAFLGGLAFGFSPYMLAHSLGHPNLILCVTPPLVLLILAELLVWQRRPALQPGVALGLLSAAQLLTTPEILLTTVLVAGFGTVLLAAIKWREVAARFRHTVIGLAIAAIVFIPLAAFPLGFLFFGPQHVGGVVREQDIYVTDLLNFIVPTPVMLLSPQGLLSTAQAWTGDNAEWNGYVGVPLLLLLLFIAIRWRTQLLVQWLAAFAVVIAILSLGPHLHIAGRIHFHIPLPWLAIQRLPLFDNILPARLMLFFYLAAGVALAVFVRSLRGLRAGPRFGGSAWIAVSLVLLLPAVPWVTTPNPVPDFFSGSDVQRIPAGSVALVAPFSTAPGFQLGPGQDSATLPMLWQLASGMRFRMPEGSLIVPEFNGQPSGGRPPASLTQSEMIAIQQGATAPDLSAGLTAGLHSDLAAWNVRTVIVGPMYNQGAMVKLFNALLGRDGEQEGGVYVWWDVGA